MVIKLKSSSKQNKASKRLKSAMLTGTALLFLLKPVISKDNEELKTELLHTLQHHPAKEWKIQENKHTTEKISFNSRKDTIDYYKQMKSYVDTEDMAYFNQLKKYQEAKDITEQNRSKAVVHAILRDTIITPEQKKMLALAQFETSANMPHSDYRFSKKSSDRIEKHPKDTEYRERAERYLSAKSYLS
ncbi:TPA: hypothetical protein DCZ39_05220 [Patescibacteria group bacterium]|nr:hypothetical protein [Candidatus Gracilibacteria bacterium]